MKKFSESRDAIWDEAMGLTRETMRHAAAWIDEEFGKGYAKRHPEVLASFISSTMSAYSGSVIAAAVQDRSDKA